MTPIRRNLLYIFRGDLLRLRLTWPEGTMTLSTGRHVDRARWDGQRCRNNTTHGPRKTPASIINAELRALEERVDNAFLPFELTNTMPTAAQIKALLKPGKAQGVTIGETIPLYLKRMATLNQWSDSTRRLAKQSLDNLLLLFGPDAVLDNIQEQEKAALLDYLLHKKCYVTKHTGGKPQRKEGLGNGTVNRYMSFIYAFATWSVEQVYARKTSLSGKVKYMKTVPNPVVYLTMEELDRFLSVELTPERREMADAFLFACFTGLRFSDLSNLEWRQVSDTAVSIVTKKTHDPLRIELNRWSRGVLERRGRGEPGDKVFRITTNANYNRVLKGIAKEAGIDTPVTVTTYCGAQRIDTTLPKWHYITSHTPRRTFVTNALSIGIPPAIVMQWTGHKNFKAMKPYIDIVSDEKAKAMQAFDGVTLGSGITGEGSP